MSNHNSIFFATILSVTLIILGSITSCKEEGLAKIQNESGEVQGDAFPNLEKMLGKWQTNDDLFMEKWDKVNDSIFAGFGFANTNGFVKVYEIMTLQQAKDGIYYKVDFVADTLKKEIPFKLSSFDGKKAVFENRAHPFPKTIVYQFNPEEKMMTIKYQGDQKSEEKVYYNFR